MANARTRSCRWGLALAAGCTLALLAGTTATPPTTAPDPAFEYRTGVQPIVREYCLSCHSHKAKKGDLDLERFSSLEEARKDLRPWQAVVEMLESGEMPPKKKPQPTAQQRRRLLAWVRGFLDAEARGRAGDPGRVVVRRLSNAEYNNTVCDLTGVDLQPARDFPVDGAAGEGFTNAGDALVTSPTLLAKYLAAAKEIAAHAVLLPDGFRFSPTKTRRDWTDEALASLRGFYGQYSADGALPLRPYLSATLRHRDDLAAGRITLEEVARRENLNGKYLRVLWQTLTDRTPSFPLDSIRVRWRQARPQDTEALAAEVSAWQSLLWRFVPIGSYRYGNTVRQLPRDPQFSGRLHLEMKPSQAPGQKGVVLYLVSRAYPPGKEGGSVVWERPRFVAAGKPDLLLRDYADFGSQFEVDLQSLFADTARYLTAAAEAASSPDQKPQALARKHHLDAVLLQRWIDLLSLEPPDRPSAADRQGRPVPAVPFQLLDTPTTHQGKEWIKGWRPRGADLPVVISNSSGQVEHVPGRVGPHGVAVHPMPTQFVAVVWKSPLDGKVKISGKVAHAHPDCGNGVSWWLEHRRADRAAVLAEGSIDLGKEAEIKPTQLKMGKGDLVTLAVDARDGNHICDLTEIAFNLAEVEKPNRTWDLARDVADTIGQGNPHADRLGNAGVWRFVQGPVRPMANRTIPAGSVLERWRSAASDRKQQASLDKLAEQVQALLSGDRPAQQNLDRLLYDTLLSLDGPLLQGMDLARLRKAPPTKSTRYGLERARFDADSLVVPATSVVEVRLPALLFQGRAFAVETKLAPGGPDHVVQFRVLGAPPQPDAPFDPDRLVAEHRGEAAKRLLAGLQDFRRCFPSFLCYSRVIPDDEVVCLKLFHREDDFLRALFLDDEQARKVDRLWSELRFISQFPVTEHKQLPLFIGFVTQDQPKELLAYFESQREPFRKRAEDFLKEVDAAAPRQLDALVDFAAQAYRRPLQAGEKAQLLHLYDTLRKKNLSHEEAFRTMLTRVLVAPSFLFRIEQTPAGKEAQPVSSWELATRLSYFLWATAPDAELRRLAAEGRLHEPQVLSAQVGRMLKDTRSRGLAVEFAAQWLHVRDIQQNREKNEKLFPTFNDELRAALFEETVLFCQDLFQSDRPLHNFLDADHTFLNETLARHYGIPGVKGPQWRRVTGVKKYGRGGVLTLASVLTKQAGASRTSPVLRGNWLVETMLGEKLPKPPPGVPQLPEEETASDATVRQMVERHTRIAECVVCHQRIDPFGFALEKYDPIGRFRDRDLGGRPVDTRVRLKDGTRFDGVEGLRAYLLEKRRQEFERHFCQKLLGYALGRAVTLSDQPLLDAMMDALKKNEYRLSAAVQAIVSSRQFRYHRGLDATKDE
jgi:mono/diheme cytochrome c family protein